MLLIKARWFGCKHVAYNLEISIQLGCSEFEVSNFRLEEEIKVEVEVKYFMMKLSFYTKKMLRVMLP